LPGEDPNPVASKRLLDVVVDGEKFSLTTDGARDIGSYDFFKDIARLERYVSAEDNTMGYALLLTNDDLYWKESIRNGGISLAFFFRGFGTGVMSSDRRRASTGRTSSGCPSASKAWWSLGTS
jgi:hypothetical protein